LECGLSRGGKVGRASVTNQKFQGVKTGKDLNGQGGGEKGRKFFKVIRKAQDGGGEQGDQNWGVGSHSRTGGNPKEKRGGATEKKQNKSRTTTSRRPL